jgi:drug/metabolite transporter (DMT)-like permease
MSEQSEHSARREVLGASLGLATAVFTAIFLLCYREAGNYAGRDTIVFAMLLGAAVFNSMVTLSRWKSTPKPGRSWLHSALFLAAMSVLGNAALAAALPKLGPGVTSTIMQLQIFFVAGGAWLFLREHVGLALILGALLAAGGFSFFAIPASASASLSAYGLVAGLITALSFAAMMVWTRAVIRDLDPVSLNAGRLWISVVALALFPNVLNEALHMPWRGWLLTIAAAACGPFLARLALMYSLRFISAAQTKLWSMLSPVFAFLFVFLVYGSVPTSREVIGGLLIICGVLLPTIVRLRRSGRAS